MRISLGWFLLVAGYLANPQSSTEFHSRYGEPDIEHFIVRPGIGLTVEYGSDRLACDVLIEPPRPLLRTDEHDLFMSSEAVTSVLDEVVPLSMRGKNLRKFDSEIGCNKSEETEYENVSITRLTNECMPLKREREIRATVTSKRAICRGQSKQVKSAH